MKFATSYQEVVMNTQNPNFKRSDKTMDPPKSQRGGFLWIGAALGALAFYFMDPVQGRQRRARASDRLTHWNKIARKKTQQKLHHWTNLYRGAQARARQARQPASDLEVTETVETFVSY